MSAALPGGEPVRRIIRLADAAAWFLFVPLIAVTAALLVISARAKHFWHDEVYTILAAGLPPATLWRASLDGLDLSPPLNTLLTRGVHLLLGVGPIATRLPAMVALLAATDVLVAAVIAVAFIQHGGRAWEERTRCPGPFAERRMLAAWINEPEPVVVTGGVDYLAVWYDAPPASRPKLIYLADPEEQMRLTGTDTSDRGYLALARWTDVPVQRVEPFLAAHPRFWVYSVKDEWIERSLRRHGVVLSEQGRERGHLGNVLGTLYYARVRF